MRHDFKPFFWGAVSAMLVVTCGVSALAASGTISITVNPNISIKVNGETFKPKDSKGNDAMVFEYNGTTYAPLRALAEAYGLEVGWDGNAKMASVGEQGTIQPDPMDQNDNQVLTGKKLADMTYDEFKQVLVRTPVNNTVLTEPVKDGETNVIYHVQYKFVNSEYEKQWEDFENSHSQEYINDLIKECQNEAPYNVIAVHFRIGNVLKTYQ